VVLFFILALIQLILREPLVVRSPQLAVLESGFEALKSGASLRSSFFVLVALFVLFDIELVLFFPGVIFFYGLIADVFSF